MRLKPLEQCSPARVLGRDFPLFAAAQQDQARIQTNQVDQGLGRLRVQFRGFRGETLQAKYRFQPVRDRLRRRRLAQVVEGQRWRPQGGAHGDRYGLERSPVVLALSRLLDVDPRPADDQFHGRGELAGLADGNRHAISEQDGPLATEILDPHVSVRQFLHVQMIPRHRDIADHKSFHFATGTATELDGARRVAEGGVDRRVLDAKA